VKELRGGASAAVRAKPPRCLEVLSDLEGYARWHPELVRDVRRLDGDRARAVLHVAWGPVNRDLDVTLAVKREGQRIRLIREAHERSDHERFEVTWNVEPVGAGARIDLALDAALDVPRLLPLGGIADAMAQGFVAAAARELDGQ
jgi:Polyketide cyclase / dehydrase and lipid transport